jgi:ATP-dependent protease HslVU (ClpYQ) ATPase subunit
LATKKVTITDAYIRQQLEGVLKDEDLSKFIL